MHITKHLDRIPKNDVQIRKNTLTICRLIAFLEHVLLIIISEIFFHTPDVTAYNVISKFLVGFHFAFVVSQLPDIC